MALRALCTDRVPYTLKREEESSNPTVFFLKPPTAEQHAGIRDRKALRLAGDGELRESPGTWTLYAVQQCLVGWENLLEPKSGEPVAFKPSASGVGASMESVDRLHQDWRYELAIEIDKLGDPSEEDLEPSVSPSS